MPEFEQREGSGVLFKNTRKTNPKAPDYSGNALVNGVEMEVAAGVKEGKNGKFFSLSIKPKDGARPRGRDPRSIQDDPNDVPF